MGGFTDGSDAQFLAGECPVLLGGFSRQAHVQSRALKGVASGYQLKGFKLKLCQFYHTLLSRYWIR